MTDRELTGDEAQRALSEAMRRTRATVPVPTPAELVAFVRKWMDTTRGGLCEDEQMFSALLSVLEQKASSVATGAGTDLMVKELHERANVCTRNAYQHRKDGQEMSAQFHLGAAMAFRDMADKLSSAPVPLPDAAPSPTWREIASATDQTAAPWDGEPVLIVTNHNYGSRVHRAFWTNSIHGGDIFGWAVTDCKFGPYALRGYTLVTHWQPLPLPPSASPPATKGE